MKKKDLLILLFFFALPFVFFYKSLFVYFVQDDFFLLRISQVHTIIDFLNLWIPSSEVVWYRPLSSQLFFFIARSLFGLNPFFYHSIVLLTHGAAAWALYYFIIHLTKNKKVSLLSAFIYAIHGLHTISLSWLATYSFILGPLFLILMLLFYAKKYYKRAFLVFCLGVLTIEIFPIFILALITYIYLFKDKISKIQYLPYFAFTFLTVFVRVILFPTKIHTNLYNFSLSLQIFSTLKFYTLRLLGFPLAIDQMTQIHRLLTLSIGILFTVTLFGSIMWNNNQGNRNDKLIPFFFTLGVIGIIPFLPLSSHSAPYYLSFTLVGFAPFCAVLYISLLDKTHKSKNILELTLLLIIMAINILAIYWTYQNHWIFKRAILSEKLIRNKIVTSQPGTEEYFALGANSAAEVFKSSQKE